MELRNITILEFLRKKNTLVTLTILVAFLVLLSYLGFSYAKVNNNYKKMEAENDTLNIEIKKLKEQTSQLGQSEQNQSGQSQENQQWQDYVKIADENRKLAEKNHDESFCEKILPFISELKQGTFKDYERRDECFIYLAKLKGSASLCAKLSSEYLKADCSKYFNDKLKAENSQPTVTVYQDMPNWLTYKGRGFELKYPPSLFKEALLLSFNKTRLIGDNTPLINIALPCTKDTLDAVGCEYYFSAYIQEWSPEIPFGAWIEKNAGCGGEIANVGDASIEPYGESIVVDDIEGVKLGPLHCPPGGGGPNKRIYLPKDSNVYSMRQSMDFSGCESEQVNQCIEESDKLFNQILSTFKFVK